MFLHFQKLFIYRSRFRLPSFYCRLLIEYFRQHLSSNNGHALQSQVNRYTSLHLSSTYYTQNTVISALFELTHLTCSTTSWGRSCYYYSYSTDEKQFSHLPKVTLLFRTFNHHWAWPVEQCQGHHTRSILSQIWKTEKDHRIRNIRLISWKIIQKDIITKQLLKI